MFRIATISAALMALTLAAGSADAQETTFGNYCLKQAYGTTECNYPTVANCVASKIGNSDACFYKGPPNGSAERSYAAEPVRAFQ